MFLRIETGFKAGLSDPAALKLGREIQKMHSALNQRIRWMRKLNVAWLEFDAPREKLVQAVQLAFKNPVIDWVFTGDLLPSAAGKSGTLLDIMQDSPHRPGVFFGIEKRKRLKTHDQESLVLKDAMQTILQRKLPTDRVVTGELLLLEGAKLSQSDLEWVAKHAFSTESEESWSILSEDELKNNSRFQSEQVAKYFTSPSTVARSRLLQFREKSESDAVESWPQVKDRVLSTKASVIIHAPRVITDEWSVIPDVRMSDPEYGPVKHQIEHIVRDSQTQMQTVLAVLPHPDLFWKSDEKRKHPVRIRENFENLLTHVAESTDTAIATMKCFLETHEEEASYYWTGTLSVDLEEKFTKLREAHQIADLFFVGFSHKQVKDDLVFVEKLKAFYLYGIQAKAIAFATPTAGFNLIQILKSLESDLGSGFEIVVDGIRPWFQEAMKNDLGLGLLWGVPAEQHDWFKKELKARNLPFLHIGTTSENREIQFLENGTVALNISADEFFAASASSVNRFDALLSEPAYMQEKRVQPLHFKNRYSVEKLVLKPENHHLRAASPLVFRPSLKHWSGLMVSSDLSSGEFDAEYLDYLLRKCTAMGGQIESLQTSFINGLKRWWDILVPFERDFGLTVTATELIEDPSIHAHWIALQVISKVADIRTIRTEDFKFPNDRIYWIPGTFEHPATRWLSNFEGRNQNALHSAIAIEPSQDGLKGVIDTLSHALVKRRFGAEVRLQHHFPGGFFVSLGENERFSVEEEWRSVGIEFEFVGRVTSTPYLTIRNDQNEIHTVSIEDLI